MAQQGKDRIGQQLGNYQLMRFLGQGGFAEVYLGQHVFLQTYAAMKILRTQLTQEEQEGFLREARTIAHLTHPHIIRVLDFGMQGELPFLVMDYAPNGSLRDHYPRGTRVALDTVVDYVKQIAAALQYAHNEKLIHRDIKPENLLVGRKGEVLLSDFGISVLVQSTHSQRTQEVVGSVPYMAPEQLQGKPRLASDQYALGIVVYEWLCGDRPFQGSFTEVYGQQLLAPPPSLRARDPSLSPDVEFVVMTALAKDPHQRFGSIQAFANALEQALPSPAVARTVPAQSFSPALHAQTTVVANPAQILLPPDAPTVPPPLKKRVATPRHISRRAVLAGGLGALVLAGGGGAWYFVTHHYPPQGTLIFTYPEHSDSVQAVAWYGARIASGGNDSTVQIWDATSGANPHIYHDQYNQINALAWSPDGQRVVFADSNGTAQVWNTSATTPAVTYTGHQQNGSGSVYTVAWEPSPGEYIASGGEDGTVQVWNPSTGRRVYTYTGHISNGYASSVTSVAWSPDGTRIASGSNDASVQIWDALTGKHVYKYTGHQFSVRSVSWSPDGTQLVSGGDDHTVQIWKPTAQGQAFVYARHTDTITSVAWSPDGHYIASASADKTVHVWKADNTTQPYIYKGHHGAVNAVVWAGDSHRLASGSDDKTVQIWEGV